MSVLATIQAILGGAYGVFNLVKLGYRWKIGDGSQINDWSSPWICSLLSLRLLSAPPPQMDNLMVCDLMNFNLRSLNNILIINIFPASEASAICGLPLHVRRLIDTKNWHHSIDMNYTVKTAYRLCLPLAVEIVPSSTSTRVIEILFGSRKFLLEYGLYSGA
jgi:hypothetical protein